LDIFKNRVTKKEFKTNLQSVTVDTHFASKLADGEAQAEVIPGKSGILIVDPG